MGHPAPILDYQMVRVERPPLAWRIAALVVCSPLVAVPFLPFAHSISPWDAVQAAFESSSLTEEELAPLGAPFFLAIVLTCSKARQWFLRLTRIELRLMQLLAAMILAVEIWTGISFSQEADMTDAHQVSVMLGYLLMLAVTIGFGVVQPMRRAPLEMQVQTLLALCFLANALLCLFSFHWRPNIGYFVTIYACVVIAVDLLWLCSKGRTQG